MLTITPDITKENVVETMNTVVAALECFPGNEVVRVEFFNKELEVHELKQKVDLDIDLLELLYAIEGIEIFLS